VNLEGFPVEIRNDIEDQSLDILEIIIDDIVVIGGWAVRVLLGKEHKRFTLDVDGVTSKDKLDVVKDKLIKLDLKPSKAEWGIKYHKKYIPKVDIPEELISRVDTIELRIEISEPLIKEDETHYFEFSVTNTVRKDIEYHNQSKALPIKVPPIEHMVANKLGLPADYKNNYDIAVLLRESDIEDVISTIRGNDDWYEMVIRRLPKLIGRINNSGGLEQTLAINSDIDIKEHIKKLRFIEKALK
jgi:hypothetical protein